MKILKIVSVIAVTAALSGCGGEKGEVIYEKDGNEGIVVYLQEDEGQKLYRNDNDNFKIACNDDWEVKIDEDGYLAKFSLAEKGGNVWLGVRKDIIDPEKDNLKSLSDKYSEELKEGIVKSANVTIGGEKGKWIKVEAIEGSGIVMKDGNGENVKIDSENLAKSDENEPREDLIFVTKENFAYVFKYHADNLSLYNYYEKDIDKFLATFQFIEENDNEGEDGGEETTYSNPI